LPHGIWPSDDGSRMYIGLENGDAVDVIDTAKNAVVAHIPIGQAPQALVYVSNAVPQGEGKENLAPRPATPENINIPLKPTASDAKGFVVVRNLGLVDVFEVSVYKLKPQAVYRVYVSGQKTPTAVMKTNDKGMANVTAIGPLREAISGLAARAAEQSRIFVMEGEDAPDAARAVLLSP
jgi:YVTN family beta-propeller protein